MKDIFMTEMRRTNYKLWLLDAKAKGDPVVATIVGSPFFQRALALRNSLTGEALGINTAIVATIADDDKLLARARGKVRSGVSVPLAALEAAIHPGIEQAQQWNAFVQTLLGGK